jgi:hypothetical protein
MPREGFLTLPPDSDRYKRVSTKTLPDLSTQKFVKLQLVACTFAPVVSPIPSVAHTMQ